MASKDAKEWKKATLSEYVSQIKCKTWEIIDKPDNRKTIGNRLVFRKKFNENGHCERHKVRLVAKGFAQQAGVDYQETFAPVVRSSSIRLLMALAVELDLLVEQMDVVTAYLNGDVEEEIYMDVPDGLEDILKQIVEENEENEEVIKTSRKWLSDLKDSSKVCRIKKSLYGLKQSGRQWYKKLDRRLREIGMQPLNAEPCIYISKKGEDIMLIAIYVDDLIITCNNMDWIKQMKSELKKKFEMKDLGAIHFCLGIEFHQDIDKATITMSQSKYTEEVLQRFAMQDSKPISTPLEANNKLKKPKNSSEESMENFPYQSLVGSLMYLAVSTRPDISYAVSSLSQFNTSYNEEHWKAGKRVLRYLRGTVFHGLIFKKSGQELQGFVDADWGGCINDRRSFTGYAFKLANGAVSWEAKKQRTVALSSTEAEYMAMTEATKEAIYLRQLLDEIGISTNSIRIYNDNQGAQKLVRNPIFHSRTKHIDIRHHFIRDAYETGVINLEYMSTNDMPADVLTKGLFAPKHQTCIQTLGVHYIDKNS